MTTSRRTFLSGAAAFAVGPLFAAGRFAKGGRANPYETADGRATDSVYVRRVFLDLVGRLPTADEARAFVASTDPLKRQALADRLLADDGYADFWGMRFCDLLRVKSEFPINLWPNAVYTYHRRIRDFVRTDEPWDRFARALLLSSGSDFRDAESNFYRATANRTPAGWAETALQTFLGERWRQVPGADVKKLAPLFSNVRIKNTREWKEEIVCVEGADRRRAFADRLAGDWRRPLAAGLVERTDFWLFDRTKPKAAHVDEFLAEGLRLKPFLRRMVLSEEYARGPLAGGFRCRRLDAEQIEDAICDLTGMKRDYQSIAPEPFTFLPKGRRTVAIEDGSITGAFLLLFGRPPRDSGLLAERDNAISSKQRLYLFNSGRLFKALSNFTYRPGFNRLPYAALVDEAYWSFYSRPPTLAERQALVRRQQAQTKKRRWAARADLAWALANSREFLYRH